MLPNPTEISNRYLPIHHCVAKTFHNTSIFDPIVAILNFGARLLWQGGRGGLSRVQRMTFSTHLARTLSSVNSPRKSLRFASGSTLARSGLHEVMPLCVAYSFCTNICTSPPSSHSHPQRYLFVLTVTLT